jgi:hypothetical protein
MTQICKPKTVAFSDGFRFGGPELCSLEYLQERRGEVVGDFREIKKAQPNWSGLVIEINYWLANVLPPLNSANALIPLSPDFLL